MILLLVPRRSAEVDTATGSPWTAYGGIIATLYAEEPLRRDRKRLPKLNLEQNQIRDSTIVVTTIENGSKVYN